MYFNWLQVNLDLAQYRCHKQTFYNILQLLNQTKKLRQGSKHFFKKKSEWDSPIGICQVVRDNLCSLW